MAVGALIQAALKRPFFRWRMTCCKPTASRVITISHNPKVPFSEFQGSDGIFFGTFAVEDGVLRWHNKAFASGAARFCRVRSSSRVFATFDTPDNVPVGCEPVQLIAYPSM